MTHDAPDLWQPWQMEGALSRRVDDGPVPYRLDLYLPPQPAPALGYPLLVVLDGQALFPTAVGLQRRLGHRPQITGVQPVAILGIGHVGRQLYDAEQRRGDFTRGPSSQGDAGGDGDAFLAHLIHGLLPHLDDLPIDPHRLGLFGHSLAGLFVLESLGQLDFPFRTAVAASPSLWWDPEATRHRAANLAPHAIDSLGLLVGEQEQTTDDPRRASRRMVDLALHLARQISEVRAARRFHHAVLPQTDHAGTADAGLRLALAMASAN